MSKDENLKRMYKDSSPESKLAGLRNEMILPISTVRGYARLIKDKVSANDIDGLSEDFEEMLERIIEAGDTLQEILEAFTGKITKDS